MRVDHHKARLMSMTEKLCPVCRTNAQGLCSACMENRALVGGLQRLVQELSTELLATQGAIEELSIGVWPEGWAGEFVAVFRRWPLGVDGADEVKMDDLTKIVSVKPAMIKGLFAAVNQKIGGMHSFAQRLYSENRNLEREVVELKKALER